MKTVLFVPLFIQVFRIFSRRTLVFITTFYMILICGVIFPNMGLLEGMAYLLLGVAVGSFFISYDFLYMRIQSDQAKSQQLLADLQLAHQKLQEYTAQADEVSAIQEHNYLARELHDSVSQAIFSISLTSKAARLLLEREPASRRCLTGCRK